MQKPLIYLAAAAALLLTACEDPSGVGLGLIGESGGEPQLESVPVEGLAAEPVSERMGGAVIQQNLVAIRFLAGAVDDPLIGRIETRGYVDFSTTGGISDEFRNGTVTAATLRLTTSYVYGDTTSSMTLQVAQMVDEWDAADSTAADLSAGGIVTTMEIEPTANEIRIPLPQDWITANDEVLRSRDFTSEFQGFELQGIAGNTVVGFGTTTAALHVVAAGDTVAYPASRVLTTSDAQPGAELTDRLVQDGTGFGLEVQLPATVAELGPAGINGVVLRLPADTLALEQQKPAGFVRPVLRELRLTGRARDDASDPDR